MFLCPAQHDSRNCPGGNLGYLHCYRTIRCDGRLHRQRRLFLVVGRPVDLGRNLAIGRVGDIFHIYVHIIIGFGGIIVDKCYRVTVCIHRTDGMGHGTVDSCGFHSVIPVSQPQFYREHSPGLRKISQIRIAVIPGVHSFSALDPAGTGFIIIHGHIRRIAGIISASRVAVDHHVDQVLGMPAYALVTISLIRRLACADIIFIQEKRNILSGLLSEPVFQIPAVGAAIAVILVGRPVAVFMDRDKFDPVGPFTVFIR